MEGAREYASLFPKDTQYGRLYLCPGAHARGKTFHIFVMPDELPYRNPWLVKDAVEVYGVLGGNPGWTEYYGWLHKGPWQQDFFELVKNRKAEIVAERKLERRKKEAEEKATKEHVRSLLSKYPRKREE